MRYMRKICSVKNTVVIIFCTLCLVCFQCSSQTLADTTGADNLSFWKPNLLYQNGRQCQRLYVEIDTLQGCQPDDDTISSLGLFLKQYCAKPGGIKIIQENFAASSDTDLTRPELLALEQMNGPDEIMPESTAYLYILFYDSKKLTGKNKKLIAPFVRLLPYPSAIYIDISYINKHSFGGLRKHQAQLLKHEVGHVLGLKWSQEENHDWHCPKKECLMYKNYEIDFFKLFTFQKIPQKEFCQSCKEYLNKTGSDQQDETLRFMGPVMVRSEKDYHVLSLPGFVKIHIGSLDSVKWTDVLAQAKIETPISASKPNSIAIVVGADDSAGIDESAINDKIIAAAKTDPSITIRRGANAIQQGLNKQAASSNKTVASWMKKW
jgi:hypothetical protein